MLNFNFYNPTRIIFGGDTIAKINDYVPTEAKVLMLFGGESARKNGTLAEVREALGAREIHEFGGIEPNPSYESCRADSRTKDRFLDGCRWRIGN